MVPVRWVGDDLEELGITPRYTNILGRAVALGGDEPWIEQLETAAAAELPFPGYCRLR